MRSKVNPSLYTSPPPPPRRKEKMSSLKKFKPPRSGKMINICSVKNVIVFPQKYCWGGGGGMFVHPKKEPTHTEKMALTWRERTAQIEKNAPIRKKATPMDFFIHSAYSCSLLSPGERLLLPPPLRAPIMTPPPPLTLFLFFREF